jgi:hypothetical protein
MICSHFLYSIPETLTPVQAILLRCEQISTEANKSLRMIPKLFKAITVYPGSCGQRPIVFQWPQAECISAFVSNILHS